MATRISSNPPAASQQRQNPSPNIDDIRQRAYELYEQRGREDGRDVDDWLRAEDEIKRRRSRGFAA